MPITENGTYVIDSYVIIQRRIKLNISKWNTNIDDLAKTKRNLTKSNYWHMLKFLVLFDHFDSIQSIAYRKVRSLAKTNSAIFYLSKPKTSFAQNPIHQELDKSKHLVLSPGNPYITMKSQTP